MSEMSEKARSEGKEKVKRLTSGEKGKIDASGWTEDEYGAGLMHTEKKLGNRPISKQNLACGGKAAHRHSGRKSRDMGGPMMGGGAPMSNAGANYVANVPAPPQNRFSFTGNQSPLLAAAGMNKGGKAKLASGGLPIPGSKEDQDAADAIMAKCRAARAAREATRVRGRLPGAGYGALTVKMPPQEYLDAAHRANAANPMKTPINRRDGGLAEEIEGKRPQGGRMARKDGGSAKKGMNVNIIIAQKPDHPQMPGGPPGAPPPMKPPMPMPPPGAPPPMGGPQGAPAGPMPGGPNMPPPSMQPHARGGKVYPDMKHSAANGLGRKEKARKYGA